jgi:hypothetical protein
MQSMGWHCAPPSAGVAAMPAAIDPCPMADRTYRATNSISLGRQGFTKNGSSGL